MIQKMRAHSGKKLHGNWETFVMWTVGVVGAQGQLTQVPNVSNPTTKYKRSKNVFTVTSIALSIGQDWPRSLQPRETRYPPHKRGYQGGYRDLARLLGESWWSKKWGAIGEKNCTEIEKQLLSERSGLCVYTWFRAQMCPILDRVG